MNIFERVIQGSVFGDVWHQVQQYLFNEKRWIQLLSLKPIEIYTTKTDIELDGAKVDLDIKAFIENIVQKRISNARNYLSLGFLSWKTNRQTYNFKVIVKAKTDYKSIGNFFTHHFANKKYDIEENVYAISLKEFIVQNKGTKVQIEIPFTIYAKRWYLKKQYEGKAIFLCSIIFNDPNYSIRTRNLSYTIESKSMLLKWIDKLYHKQILDFLNTFFSV
jgi:hypothetical protein